MRKLLALLAVALATQAAAEQIVQGTVDSVLAAPDPEEPWEDTHLSYEDPADGEPREQVRVRLDDGREVVIFYAGPRRLEAGQRVRLYLGGRSPVLL
jgi:hypothetical protein